LDGYAERDAFEKLGPYPDGEGEAEEEEDEFDLMTAVQLKELCKEQVSVMSVMSVMSLYN
tara:strand:- start:143 stop:322 length:180 start_codon:yes stop_codon:yes gene_type:complete